MAFTDFSAAGLKTLNDHLSTRSYISGYAPSTADVAVFDGLKDADTAKVQHVARWASHIGSFAAEIRAAWTAPVEVVVEKKAEKKAAPAKEESSDDESEDEMMDFDD
eukprot:378954_1